MVMEAGENISGHILEEGKNWSEISETKNLNNIQEIIF